MEPIIDVTLDAMRGDVARLERVATNLANVSTPGYRREIWVQRTGPSAVGSEFARLYDAESARGPVESAAVDSTLPGGIERDQRPSTLKPTGQSLDLALAGGGYFEVATEQGPAYTRHGQFRLDGRGRIVTAQGHALIGKSGEISLSSLDATIDGSGRIHQSDRIVDQVKVVEFASGTRLTALGAGLLGTPAAARPLEDGAVQVRQGYLENSNVDSAHEMVALMQTMRHFESLQRVAQGYDEMLGTAIRKLGDL